MKVRNIVLFGSVAQDRATSDSDIDLFIDVELNKTQNKNFKRLLNKIIRALQIRYEKKPAEAMVYHGMGRPEKNRGAFLNKLYGYSVKKKRYSGMIKN